MYVDIAKGHHDRASLQLLGFFIALSTGGFVAAIGSMFSFSKKLHRENDALAIRVQSLGKTESKSKTFSKEDALDELEKLKNRLRKTDRLALATALMVLVMVVALMTSATRIAYVDSAVANFEQVLSITRPYLMEPRKEEFIRSTFSQVRNKGDYEKIIMELRAVAQENGQYVPEFNIW